MDWVAPAVAGNASARNTLRRLALDGANLLAPRLLLEEVTNALLTGVRLRRWSGAQTDASFALLRQMPVKLADTPADLGRAYELARRYDDHPIYDMLYVALSERPKIQLITADADLRSRLASLSWVIGLDDA